MDIKIEPTRNVRILGLDERSLENLLWCALSFRMDRVFWAEGYLFCVEVYEKAFEYEVERAFFPISQICYTRFPKYERLYEVKKGVNIPIVNVSDMKLYQEIVRAIQRSAKEGSKNASDPVG